MNPYARLVRNFHEKFGQPIGERPEFRRGDLRAKLILEEAFETARAIWSGDMVETVDGLCDLLYVIFGTAIEFGVDLDRFFAEVHRSNMRKEGGGSRTDGKILKPDGWKPPRIADLLDEINNRDPFYLPGQQKLPTIVDTEAKNGTESKGNENPTGIASKQEVSFIAGPGKALLCEQGSDDGQARVLVDEKQPAEARQVQDGSPDRPGNVQVPDVEAVGETGAVVVCEAQGGAEESSQESQAKAIEVPREIAFEADPFDGQDEVDPEPEAYGPDSFGGEDDYDGFTQAGEALESEDDETGGRDSGW